MSTGRYLQYTEHVPGSLLIAPSELLERPLYELVPPHVADSLNQAIHDASTTRMPAAFRYEMKGRRRRGHLLVLNGRAHVKIYDDTAASAVARAAGAFLSAAVAVAPVLTFMCA